MASLEALVADVVSVPAFGNAVRAVSDLEDTRDHIADGGEVIQVSAAITGWATPDSNFSGPIVTLEIGYHKQLDVSEHQWVHVDSEPIQRALQNPATFQALASVRTVLNRVQEDRGLVEREGHVVTLRAVYELELA